MGWWLLFSRIDSCEPKNPGSSNDSITGSKATFPPWGRFRKYVWFWENQKTHLSFYNGCLWKIDIFEHRAELRPFVSKIILQKYTI